MNWVEFIGPSGTGKTTFQDLVLKRRKSVHKWVSLREGVEEIVASSFESGIRGKLRRLYFLQKIFKSDKERYVHELIENIDILQHPSYNPFVDRFFAFMTSFEILSAAEKIQYINWFTHIIKTMNFFDIHDYQTLVIMDEGLYNNTPGLEIVDWKKVSLYPRACVFFHLAVETNFKWINERRERGIVRNIHKDLFSHELLEYVQRDHARFQAKRDVLIQNKVPIYIYK